MDAVVNSLEFRDALHLFLNTLVLTHLTGHYGICLIRGMQDDIHLHLPRNPVVSLVVDESPIFEGRLLRAINVGCEGFVLTDDSLLPFLDGFRSVHEAASFRGHNKRIIAITQLDGSVRERITQHDAMEVTPNILLAVPNVTDRTVEVYTTKLSPLEPRGISTELVSLERIHLDQSAAERPLLGRFPDKRRNMQGRRIRVVTLPYPPCTVVNEVPFGQGNARSTLPANYSLQADGTEILLIEELCRRHNCTLEIELVENSAWGQLYPNGTSDGLIGSLNNRRSDVAVAAIYRWYKWYPYITMSAYIGRSGITGLVPRPRRLPFWLTPFLSFPPSLWLMVSVSFCAGTTAVFVIEQARHRIRLRERTANRYQLIDAVFFMTGLYVEQSVPLPNDTVAGAILLSFLLFGGFMVGNSYAGALACVMTIPRYEKSIDTLADFVAGGLTLTGSANAWMNALQLSQQPDLVKIRNAYQVHNTTTLARYSHTRRDVGYVHERLQYGSYALESFIDINATLMLQALKEDLYWEQIIVACSKTWPMAGFLDDLILRVQQNGIQRYWEMGSVFRNMGTEIQRNLANARVQDGENEPVKLLIAHFLGVFFILFVGLTTASVAFIGEHLVYRMKTDRLRLRRSIDPSV